MNLIPPPTLPAAASVGERQPAPNVNQLLRFEKEKKSVGLAFALCWILGIWGVHRFYLKRRHAVTMLIVTLISIPLCFVFVGFISLTAVWLWVIADMFSVSKWVKEDNVATLTRITSA